MSKILVVDDIPKNVKLLVDLLAPYGYTTISAGSGVEALDAMRSQTPDMVLLDVLMPDMNGYEVCKSIRRCKSWDAIPVVMVTALEPKKERIKGLESGADEFLSKPINRQELIARVRSLLRVKTLFDTVKSQAKQLEELNRTLEERVTKQVRQIEKLNRLRRFLSPHVADMILSGNDEKRLESHRREIAVICCDLRGFTGFSETVEPEDAIAVLHEYYHELGMIVSEYDGTIDHFTGDGMLAFVNDPIPCDRPAERAVALAVMMRSCVAELITSWKRYGYDLGLGIGVSFGYATMGIVGFEGRHEYAATGTTVNLAARLCEKAEKGQILISQRVRAELDDQTKTKFVAEFELKGIRRPVAVYNVLSVE